MAAPGENQVDWPGAGCVSGFDVADQHYMGVSRAALPPGLPRLT
jgi:hypothetical protein